MARDRRGLALLMALVALALLSALVAAGAYASLELRRGAGRGGAVVRTSLRLEQALELARARADGRVLEALPVGRDTALDLGRALAPLTPGESVSVRAARLSSTLYWLAARVRERAGNVAAEQRGALIVWLERPPIDPAAALSADGDVSIDGGWQLSPPPPECPSALEQHSLLHMTAGAVLVWPDAPAGAVVVGAPAGDPLGSDRWASLAATAAIQLPADATATPSIDGEVSCLAWSGGTNPGTSICGGEWPVVHAAGDLTLGPGRARGLLLVDGRLHLAAPLDFTGVVLARGGLLADGVGSRITGALLTPRSAEFRGAGLIAGDPCAVQTARSSAGRAVAASRRAWLPAP